MTSRVESFWQRRAGSDGPVGSEAQLAGFREEPIPGMSKYTDFRKQRLLDVAKSREPGTHLWRGEVRKDEPETAPSVGIHWSANPDGVINPADDTLAPGEHSVIWHGVLDSPEQAVSRADKMWNGIHRSMDFEAEVRMKPGARMRVLGAQFGGKYHPLNREVAVENKGELDYDGRY